MVTIIRKQRLHTLFRYIYAFAILNILLIIGFGYDFESCLVSLTTAARGVLEALPWLILGRVAALGGAAAIVVALCVNSLYTREVPLAVERQVREDMERMEAGAASIEECLDSAPVYKEVEGADGVIERQVLRVQSDIIPGRVSDLVAATAVAIKVKFGPEGMPEDSASLRRAAGEWATRRLREEHPSLRDSDIQRVITRALPLLRITDEFQIYQSRADRSRFRHDRARVDQAPFAWVAELVLGSSPRANPRW